MAKISIEETPKITAPSAKKKELSVEGLLQIVGEHGKFQFALEMVFFVFYFPSTFQILMMFFAASEPNWRCVSNSTVCNLNGTFTSQNKLRCRIPRSEWEFTKPTEYSIVTEFDIYCDRDWIIHMTTSIFFIGWMIGALIMGWVSDNYGRKKTLFISYFSIMLAGTISPFVGNVYVFILFRFAIGFFIPGAGLLMMTITHEIVGTKRRPLAGIILWTGFTSALCILPLIAYFVPRWKTLILVCSAPYFVWLLFWKFVPESIRWLRLKGRITEALEVFQRIGKWNGKEMDTDVTLAPLQQDTTSHKTNPMELFKTSEIRRKILPMGVIWMTNGMVYYGISLGVGDLGGSMYLNFALASFVELPASLLAVYFQNKTGRQKTAMVAVFLAGALTLAVAFIPLSYSAIRTTFGMIGKMLISLSFQVIYVWAMELYPTKIKSEAMGFLQITSRIGAASAPWIAKGVKVVHETLPFIIMGSLGILAGILCWFLPDTKGQEIQETEDDFANNDSEIAKVGKSQFEMKEVNGK